MIAQGEFRALDDDTPDAWHADAGEIHGDAEALVHAFAAGLDEGQRREIAFPYDHVDERGGLLRAFVANHWQVTRPAIRSDFYSPAQQALVHAIFCAMLAPDAVPRALRQLRDDCLGHPWGADQSVALFGDPAVGPYQFVFTGRHVTMRVDGGSDPRVAFGGPVFFAHAPTTYVERPGHPENVHWHEAVAASRWLGSLPADLAQRAIVPALPHEPPLGFRATIPGLPLAEVGAAHVSAAGALLDVLLSRFRVGDRARVRECVEAQGGMRALSIQFARDGRMSAPAWDCWRLEGPAFIWHWRGFPHVHVWVHVAKTPDVPVHAASGQRLFPGQDRLDQPLFPFRI
ncbi:MAG: DUF3500 domain-containing protein [Betaproteobacteria bacterium]